MLMFWESSDPMNIQQFWMPEFWWISASFLLLLSTSQVPIGNSHRPYRRLVAYNGRPLPPAPTTGARAIFEAKGCHAMGEETSSQRRLGTIEASGPLRRVWVWSSIDRDLWSCATRFEGSLGCFCFSVHPLMKMQPEKEILWARIYWIHDPWSFMIQFRCWIETPRGSPSTGEVISQVT